MKRGRFAGAVGLATCCLVSSLTASAQSTPELVSTTSLRVCADPGFLPYSNDRGEGFENRIASLIGNVLSLPVSYTWYPQSPGFLRSTLLAQKCDVVMGLNSGADGVATTNAYYHTGYMIVTRPGDHVAATSLADPAIAGFRFGVVAGTPPSDLLATHDLMAQAVAYPLVVDTRHDAPVRTMLADVAAGRIDAALAWGPFVGWAVKHDHLDLHAAFLAAEPGHARLDYHIAMAVRSSDVAYRRRLSGVLTAHRPEIEAILADAGVPLLDEQGRPMQVAVPEPAAYRTDDYRAPTPATVAGGAVVDTAALQTIMQGGNAVLLDVLPAPRQPPGMKPGTPWSPLREDIPGSVWMPEIGRGTLSRARQDWFEARLHTLTGGDCDRAVVFYCLESCWMSWNAAKRAASLGYRHVFWYPGGTEAWTRAGLPLARAMPEQPPD